jgi:hypothetical protein
MSVRRFVDFENKAGRGRRMRKRRRIERIYVWCKLHKLLCGILTVVGVLFIVLY